MLQKIITPIILACSITVTGWSFFILKNSNTNIIYEKEIEYIEIKVPVKEELQGNFLQYVEVHDILEIEIMLEECKQRKIAASQIIQAALKCGYAENHSIILLAQKEWEAAHDTYAKYKELYDKYNFLRLILLLISIAVRLLPNAPTVVSDLLFFKFRLVI